VLEAFIKGNWVSPQAQVVPLCDSLQLSECAGVSVELQHGALGLAAYSRTHSRVFPRLAYALCDREVMLPTNREGQKACSAT
jgi:hypothetical protein